MRAWPVRGRHITTLVRQEAALFQAGMKVLAYYGKVTKRVFESCEKRRRTFSTVHYFIGGLM